MPDAAADPVVDALLRREPRARRRSPRVARRSVNEDVTLPQFRSLVVLATAGPQTVSALADRLAVHASTMTRMCNRLVTRGLVVRGAVGGRSPRSGYRADDDGYISGRRRHGRAPPASSTRSCAASATTTASPSIVALNKFAQAAGEETGPPATQPWRHRAASQLLEE